MLHRIIAGACGCCVSAPLEKSLSGRAVLVAVVLFCAGVAAVSASTSSSWRTQWAAEPSATLTVASLTGFALSGALCMVTVILPAGLGAREGMLTLVLASAMPVSAGTAVALVSRFVVTLVDVLAAAAGWAYARRHHLVTSREEREHPAGETVPEEP